MMTATYRSMAPAAAADAYAEQLAEEDRRDHYIEQATHWLAESWRKDWHKIIEVVGEAEGNDAKYIGMAISTLIDKQYGCSTVGKEMLVRVVSDLLYREAEKQVRKELQHEYAYASI